MKKPKSAHQGVSSSDGSSGFDKWWKHKLPLPEEEAALTKDLIIVDDLEVAPEAEQEKGKSKRGGPKTAEGTPTVEDELGSLRPPLSAEAEARAALRRGAELITENPLIAQRLLSEVGIVVQRVAESPDVMTRKEVAEELGLSVDRVKALTAEGRLGVLVGTQNLYARSQVEEFKQTERHPGRPKSQK